MSNRRGPDIFPVRAVARNSALLLQLHQALHLVGLVIAAAPAVTAALVPGAVRSSGQIVEV